MSSVSQAETAPSVAGSRGLLDWARDGIARWRSSRPSRIRLNLGLQGGGSHGAFTWGVLDRLLDEPDLEVRAISGASAGAMNACVFATGWLHGGRGGARESLHQFWRAVSRAAHLGPLHPTPLEYLISGWNRDWSPSYLLFRAMAKLTSPYQISPNGFNPLLPLLQEHVDFERLRTSDRIKLFVAVTNLHSGALRVLRNRDLSDKALAASACLPLLFQAVELEDGEHYWDGGYSANPPLTPMIKETDSRDLLLVQLSPVRHQQVPRKIGDIVDRANEIAFNAGFLRELQMLAEIRRETGWNRNPLARKLGRLNLHQIHTDGALQAFGKVSRINAEWPFLQYLRDLGRERADQWLAEHRQHLGRSSSYPLARFAEI